MVTAHVVASVGLIGLGVFPLILPASLTYAGLVAANMLYAVGGGLLEVVVSPLTDALPGDAKSSNMAMMHGFYSWGQVLTVLLSTIVLLVISQKRWYILPILWAILPAVNAINFLRVPIVQQPAPEEGGGGLKHLLKSRIFLLALLLMTCSGASELAMSQWASLFAERGLGVSKVMGDLLGPCLFGVCMGIGRTYYGIYGEKINLRKSLIGEAVLCIVCYLAATLSPWPIVSLIGCALCGLSVALMWPGMLSLTAARHPEGGTAMFGILAVFGDVGCSLGPWLTGLVSTAVMAGRTGQAVEQAGLKAGLMAAILFPVLMIVGLLTMKEKKN